MKDKDKINELIKKCYELPSPVLREYLLLPANAFFRHYIKYAEKYLGKKEADRYRTFTQKINTAFSPFPADKEDSDNPYIKDIVTMGLKKRDERMSEAILYAVFIYPFRIISKKKAENPENII